MKARSEAELHKRGLEEREVKRGRGGIRDIEFSVQLLQLVHGRTDRRVRTPTTLDALEQLADGGYVTPGRRRPARRRVRVAANRRAPAAARRRAADPHAARRPTTRAPDSRGCWASATAAASRRSSSSTNGTARSRPSCAALHEKLFFAPILDTLAGAGRAQRRGRRRTAERVRVLRRRRAPRRACAS